MRACIGPSTRTGHGRQEALPRRPERFVQSLERRQISTCHHLRTHKHKHLRARAVWRGWLKGKSEGLLHARRESTTVRTCSLFWSRSRQACCSAVVHGWQRHWRCRLRVAFPARSRPDITAQEDRIRSIHRLEVHTSRSTYVRTVRTEDGTVGPYLFVVG